MRYYHQECKIHLFQLRCATIYLCHSLVNHSLSEIFSQCGCILIMTERVGKTSCCFLRAFVVSERFVLPALMSGKELYHIIQHFPGALQFLLGHCVLWTLRFVIPQSEKKSWVTKRDFSLFLSFFPSFFFCLFGSSFFVFSSAISELKRGAFWAEVFQKTNSGIAKKTHLRKQVFHFRPSLGGGAVLRCDVLDKQISLSVNYEREQLANMQSGFLGRRLNCSVQYLLILVPRRHDRPTETVWLLSLSCKCLFGFLLRCLWKRREVVLELQCFCEATRHLLYPRPPWPPTKKEPKSKSPWKAPAPHWHATAPQWCMARAGGSQVPWPLGPNLSLALFSNYKLQLFGRLPRLDTLKSVGKSSLARIHDASRLSQFGTVDLRSK